MSKLYSLVLLSTLLIACGGGGSETTAVVPVTGDSQPSNNVPDPIQPAVTEFILTERKPMEAGEVISSVAQTSREIMVPSGFALRSERTFSLQITRSEDDNQAAYLSVCSDYQQLNDGSYSINYDSCLLRTSLNDNAYETVITITNDTVGLVATMWFMDDNKGPLISEWRF
ncbi:MAG: hypothetical protein ACI9C4_000186 [Paraglaciecola sp.]|jgi:hypothetical protein